MKFFPVVYEHAASLIGRSPWDVSRDPELLFRAFVRAREVYGLESLVLAIDPYNVEAEAFGAVLSEPSGNEVPAIRTPAFHSASELIGPDCDSLIDRGRFPMILHSAKQLKAKFPELRVSISVTGPCTLASNLVGMETLLSETLEDPLSVQRAIVHLAEGLEQLCRQILEAGFSVMIFDSASSPPLFSPEQFKSMFLPSIAGILDSVREVTGKAPPYIQGGDTEGIIEQVLETEPGGIICPAETDQCLLMQRAASFPNIPVRINMNPVVFSGRDFGIVREEADRVIALAGTTTTTSVGTGILPYGADPEIVLRLQEYVYTRDRDDS